jgi:linoleoyl-CoA desaturase
MTVAKPTFGVPRATFVGGGEFFCAIRSEVDAYLTSSDVRGRALRALWIKTAIGFAALIGSWVFLVFGHPTLWLATLALGGLFFGGVVVSVCVLHDANHAAYFRSRRANYVLGWSVDLVLGFGSCAWRNKHNLHHSFPNVDGYDEDIAHAPFARIAPSQEPRPWYRWQHVYIWLLYSLALLRWHATDILNLMPRRGPFGRTPPPRGWHLAGAVAGKVVFVAWVFLVPSMFHPWWIVLAFYFVFTISASTFMAIIFQLAHCLEESDFVSAQALAMDERVWAVHEVESTADFCQKNGALTWFIGGLNYQIEHHLFPRLPHTIYPRIAPIVRRNAQIYGVRYTAHPSLRVALRSHYRHVRKMGCLGRAVEIEMG